MGFLNNLIVKIKGDNKDLGKKLRGSKSQVTNFSKSIIKMGASMAAAFSVRILVQWTKALTKAYDTQIKAEKLLGAAIEANGGERDKALADYKEWASEMQRISTVGDESTLRLLQIAESMGVTGENAKMAAKEAISLGKAMGMSEQSAIRYTVALQQGNATMLKRYLPSLYECEDQAEMAAKAHELLANMFTQVTEEAKAGLGPAQQLSNSWGDFKETLGGLIVEGRTFTGVMANLRQQVEAANKQIQDSQYLKDSKWIKDNLKGWQQLALWMSRFSKEGREARGIWADIAKEMDKIDAAYDKLAVWETVTDKDGNTIRRLRLFKETEEAINTEIKTLNSLTAEIKAYQDTLNGTNILQTDEIKIIYEKIAALKKEKEAIENLAISKVNRMSGGPTSPIAGVGGPPKKGLQMDNGLMAMTSNKPAENIWELIEAFQVAGKEVPAELQAMANSALEFQSIMGETMMQFSDLIADSLAQIFEGLGAGELDGVFKNILGQFGDFIANIGKMLVAYGAAMLAFSILSKNPDPVSAGLAIAAGLTAIAIGSAIKGAASKGLDSSSGGGGYSRSASSSGGTATPQNLVVEVKGTLKGSDIAISSKRYSNNLNSVT